MIIKSAQCKQYCEEIIHNFEASIEQFYYAHDYLKGCIRTKNRHGVEEQFPLLTISIAGIGNKGVSSIYDLAEEASQYKKDCKQLEGSNYLIASPCFSLKCAMISIQDRYLEGIFL